MNTPWGSADFVENIQPVESEYYVSDSGIIRVSTPSHGGIGITKKMAEQYNISNYAKNTAITANNYYWFEEDCNWSIAVLEIGKDFFAEEVIEQAIECAKRWHENYIAA